MSLSSEIARCDRELQSLEHELRAGNPEVSGIVRGIVDWAAEKRVLLAIAEEQ